jgi:hypothetical protein
MVVFAVAGPWAQEWGLGVRGWEPVGWATGKAWRIMILIDRMRFAWQVIFSLPPRTSRERLWMVALFLPPVYLIEKPIPRVFGILVRGRAYAARIVISRPRRSGR